jgi:hypothetical protein
VLGWIFTLGSPNPSPSKGGIGGTCSGAETGAENEREGRVGVRGLEGNGTAASASALPWEVASALE